MAAQERGRIAQDGGLEHLARMHHAGGQRAHRHSIDADHLIFLVQHADHEMLAVDVAQVLAKDDGRIPGAADLGGEHDSCKIPDSGYKRAETHRARSLVAC